MPYVRSPILLTTISRPVKWRAQLITASPIQFAMSRIYVNGNLLPFEHRTDALPVGLALQFDIDVTGRLLDAIALAPNNGRVTNSIVQNYKQEYFAEATDLTLEVYISTQYYFYDSLGNLNTLGITDTSSTVYVFATQAQHLETTNMTMFDAYPGMSPLSYREDYYTVQKNEQGAFLSFFWKKGYGATMIFVSLNDETGTNAPFPNEAYKITLLPPTVKEYHVQTIGIGLVNLATTVWTAGALNIASTEYDRAKIEILLAIPLGGGAYAFLKFFEVNYLVNHKPCEGVGVYWRNSLGGFESHWFNESQNTRKVAVSSDLIRTPQRMNYDLVQPYNPALRGLGNTNGKVETTISVDTPAESDTARANFWVGLASSQEVYISGDALEEFPNTLNITTLIPVVLPDQEYNYRINRNAPVSQTIDMILSNPVNTL